MSVPGLPREGATHRQGDGAGKFFRVGAGRLTVPAAAAAHAALPRARRRARRAGLARAARARSARAPAAPAQPPWARAPSAEPPARAACMSTCSHSFETSLSRTCIGALRGAAPSLQLQSRLPRAGLPCPGTPQRTARLRQAGRMHPVRAVLPERTSIARRCHTRQAGKAHVASTAAPSCLARPSARVSAASGSLRVPSPTAAVRCRFIPRHVVISMQKRVSCTECAVQLAGNAWRKSLDPTFQLSHTAFPASAAGQRPRAAASLFAKCSSIQAARLPRAQRSMRRRRRGAAQ